jgi:Proline dehydrogenase
MQRNLPLAIAARLFKSAAVNDSRPADCQSRSHFDPASTVVVHSFVLQLQGQSTLSLLRSLLVFKLCTVRPLVKHGKSLLKVSNNVLGKAVTSALIKVGSPARHLPYVLTLRSLRLMSALLFFLQHSFFAHFCAGEDAEDIKPALQRLRSAGIGAILDYAAEADVEEEEDHKGKAEANPQISPNVTAPREAAVSTSSSAVPASAGKATSSGGRTFATSAPSSSSLSPAALASKRELDGNLTLSIQGIRDASNEGGFAAVKLTSMARPELLQKVSTLLHGHRRAWRRFNMRLPPHSNPYLDLTVTKQDFIRQIKGPNISPEDASDLFDAIDYKGDGSIDYQEWSDFNSLLVIGGLEAQAAAAYSIRRGTPKEILRILVPQSCYTGSAGAGVGAAAVPESDLLGELTPSESQEWVDVLRRANELGHAAADASVSVMVDAEQTYLQPAIDEVVTTMQRTFNRPKGHYWLGKGSRPEEQHILRRAKGAGTLEAMTAASVSSAAASTSMAMSDKWPYLPLDSIATVNTRTGRKANTTAASLLASSKAATGGDKAESYPVVYNTFQAYLQDTPSRLELALRRSDNEGWLFGAKLVRGAYMVQERQLAKDKGYKDPIHPNLQATHDCYHRCTDRILKACFEQGAELMVASHNEGSVKHVAANMHNLLAKHGGGSDLTTTGVSFGQLLGMCDHISFTLGRLGYRCYKYVPYGPVMEVVPYLLRRAQENSDVFGSAGKEINFLKTELKRRFAGGKA